MFANSSAEASREQARVAAAAIAIELAHKINNPLQSLTNLVFLSATDEYNCGTKSFAVRMSEHVKRTAVLTDRLLALQKATS